MRSTVSNCNMALANIGADPINAITEDSVEAETCKLFYDELVELMLREHRWKFTVKSATLVQMSTDTYLAPADWTYRYVYPSDCRRIEKLYTAATARNDKKLAYDLELTDTDVRSIVTDTDSALIRYIKIVTDENMWDSMFNEAFVWRLSSKLAMPLTKQPSLYEMAMNHHIEAMKQAINVDGNEQHKGARRKADSLRARE